MTLDSPVKLCRLLEDLKYDTKRIAVEKNGEIIPKAQYQDVSINDSDTLEVVSFVGGG